MSKIAEKKVRELGYGKDPLYRNEYSENDVFEAGVECYDQAMQDFTEKAEEFFYEQFNIHPHDCHVVQYVSDTPLEDIDDFVEQFKNYMEDESK